MFSGRQPHQGVKVHHFRTKSVHIFGVLLMTSCPAVSYIPYLRESSAHPFQGFLGPKNRVRIRIDGALDAHAKSETTISLSVESL